MGTKHTHIAATGGDSAMGSLSGIGGGGATGWEFFVNFDAYDKESIKGTCEFIDGNSSNSITSMVLVLISVDGIQM
jgi:hypothetical protein